MRQKIQHINQVTQNIQATKLQQYDANIRLNAINTLKLK